MVHEANAWLSIPPPLALPRSRQGGGCHAATGRMVMNIRLEVTNISIDKVGETAHESVAVSVCVLREAARGVRLAGFSEPATGALIKLNLCAPLPRPHPTQPSPPPPTGAVHTSLQHCSASDQSEALLTAIVTMELTQGLTMSPWKLHLFTTCERREGRRGDCAPFVLLSALSLRFNGSSHPDGKPE